MENLYEFPDRDVIEQEAAEWLVRLDSDKLLSPQELQSFKGWISRSPVHREEIIGLSEFWSNQSLAALPIPLEKLCAEVPDFNESPNQQAWYYNRAFEAVVLVGVCIALVLNAYWLPGTSHSLDSQKALYATAIGQQRIVTLPDGSIITLNTNSQVKVDYHRQYRNIQLLQGEAHFEVAKQPERPFRVYAGRGRVQAVGTAFTVYIRDNDDVEIAVTEGTVALGVLTEDEGIGKDPEKSGSVTSVAPEQPLMKSSEYYLAIPVDELGVLEAGQATTILIAHESKGDGGKTLDNIRAVAEEELARRGAWRSGLLVFSGHSLEEVVKEISRYTTLSIEITDSELKTIRIGGRFSVESTNAFFDALEANFDLKITQLDYNYVQISSAKK